MAGGFFSVAGVPIMNKKSEKSKRYVWVTYRCESCRSRFEGIVIHDSDGVRLKCSVCGEPIIVNL